MCWGGGGMHVARYVCGGQRTACGKVRVWRPEDGFEQVICGGQFVSLLSPLHMFQGSNSGWWTCMASTLLSDGNNFIYLFVYFLVF